MKQRITIIVMLLGALCTAAACDNSSANNDQNDSDSQVDVPTDSDAQLDSASDSNSESEVPANPTDEANIDPNTTYATDADFTLKWKDDFETFDKSRWETASHSFDENEAQFRSDHVLFEDGFMKLMVTKNPNSSATKPYYGGELRTIGGLDNGQYVYGRFEVRARFAPGSGIVSSFFTYYDHWADADLAENWNEIDIEFLGKNTTAIQYNEIVWNAANQRVTNEFDDHLDFNPSETFHVYAVEWTPSGTKFYIDGVLKHSSNTYTTEMQLQQKIMMNVWPTNQSGWAGAIDDSALPTVAYYDWVKYYAYTGN